MQVLASVDAHDQVLIEPAPSSQASLGGAATCWRLTATPTAAPAAAQANGGDPSGSQQMEPQQARVINFEADDDV